MNEHSNPSSSERYAAGESWASDQDRRQRRTTRIAIMGASVVALIAILEAIAIVVMMPLKTVEPYTILVDRQTGHTMLVDPTQPRRLDPDSALNQSFLARYVIAREGYDFDLAPENYRQVMGWSAPAVRDRYANQMRADSPASPISRFSRNERLAVEILSITAMDEDTAMVRFASRLRDSNGGENGDTRWVAMIDYRYVAKPMSWTEMLDNPLGFEVTAYRKSTEAGSATSMASEAAR